MHRLQRVPEPGQRLERRVAVMTFLDIVGYSRLMGADEDSTLRRWTTMRRKTIEPCLRRWHGRVVDRSGDALFAEFRSVLDAMRWATEVQAALAPAAVESPPMQVRVAIHLGQVIDGARGALHGDGVNIAARLQAYAEPGGIIASKAAVDAVRNGLAGEFLDLGELHLRNILQPVQAYG